MKSAETQAAHDPRPSGIARSRLFWGLGLLMLGLEDLLFMNIVLLPKVLAGQAAVAPGQAVGTLPMPEPPPAQMGPDTESTQGMAVAPPIPPAQLAAPLPVPEQPASGVPVDSSFSPLLFSPNSAWLSAQADRSLIKLAALLKKDSALRVTLHGHTDDFGPERFNQVLSLKRAEHARDHLQGQGVDRSRIDIKGYGSQQPADSAHNARARARNRRVEITLF